MNKDKFSFVKAMVVLLLGFAGAGCTENKPTLNLFTWAEFIDDALIRQFEKEYQCRVVVDTFGSNAAMYTKLDMGASGYDLVTPTSYYAEMLQANQKLLSLDHGQLPNLNNLDERYQRTLSPDAEARYSVPYLVGTVGLAWNQARISDFKAEWTMLARETLRGKTTILSGERAVLGAALLANGKSLNTRSEQEIRDAADRVLEWRENIATFDNELFKSGLVNGEFFLCMAFSGDTLAVSHEAPQVRFALPEEGYPVIADVFVIPADASQSELAHAFINFMLRAESAARSMEATRFWSPNQASYAQVQLSAEEKTLILLTDDQIAKGEVIRYLGEPQEAVYRKEWERVRAGRR